MKRYYISDGHSKFGPFDGSEIQGMVFKCQINVSDMVYDEIAKTWVQVTSIEMPDYQKTVFQTTRIESPTLKSSFGLVPGENDFKDPEKTQFINPGLINTGTGGLHAKSIPAPHRPELKPKIKNLQSDNQNANLEMVSEDYFQNELKTSMTNETQIESWYVKLGNVILGPYSYTTLLGMVIEGSVRENDLIKNSHTQEWVAASQSLELSPNYLKKINTDEAQALLNRGGLKRKLARLDMNTNVHIFQNGLVEMGLLRDISLGGCALIFNMPKLRVQSEILMHINFNRHKEESNEFLPNVKGVVLKMTEKNENWEENFKYSIKFLKMTKDLMSSLQHEISKYG